MSLKDLLVFLAEFLETLIWIFEENWIYRSSDILLMEKIFANFFGAHPARVRLQACEIERYFGEIANLH